VKREGQTRSARGNRGRIPLRLITMTPKAVRPGIEVIMSFFVPRFPVAGPSRSFLTAQHPLRTVARIHPPCQPLQSRDFSILVSRHARQVLGRITPKRIAVPLPEGSGNGLPHASLWRPIVVRMPHFSLLKRFKLIIFSSASRSGEAAT